MVQLVVSKQMPAIDSICPHCGISGTLHYPQISHPMYTSTKVPQTTTATAASAASAHEKPAHAALTIDITSVPKFSLTFSRARQSDNQYRDPDRYLEALDIYLRARNHHRSVFELVMMHGCVREADRRWVQSELLDHGLSWQIVKQMFLTKFATASTMDRVYADWRALSHAHHPSADSYIEHARHLLRRIGSSESDPAVILHVESRLNYNFRQRLHEEKQKRKMQLLTAAETSSDTEVANIAASGSATEFRFTDLHQLQHACRSLEMIYPSLLNTTRTRVYPYTVGNRRRDDNGYPRRRRDSDSDTATVSKLEPSSSGTPQKVGGKRGKQRRDQPRRDRTRPHTSSSPAIAATTSTDSSPAVAAFTPSAATSLTTTSSFVPQQRREQRELKTHPRCPTCHKLHEPPHIDNFKPTCAKCGGAHGTKRHDEATRRPVKVNRLSVDTFTYVPTAPALTAPMVAATSVTQQCVFITCTRLGGDTHPHRDVLLDSGADISCVNRALIDKHNINITPPVGP
jgi:hypothetical protein